MRLAVLAHVLEEFLPRQVLAAPDDARQAAIAKPDLVLTAGLAPEPEADPRPGHDCVAVPQSRQAE